MALRSAKTGDIEEVSGPALYKVDLAPAEDEYLLWDEPFGAAGEGEGGDGAYAHGMTCRNPGGVHARQRKDGERTHRIAGQREGHFYDISAGITRRWGSKEASRRC